MAVPSSYYNNREKAKQSKKPLVPADGRGEKKALAITHNAIILASKTLFYSCAFVTCNSTWAPRKMLSCLLSAVLETGLPSKRDTESQCV